VAGSLSATGLMVKRVRARGLAWFVVLSTAFSPLQAERTPDQSPIPRNVDFAAEEATIAGIHAAVAAGQMTCVESCRHISGGSRCRVMPTDKSSIGDWRDHKPTRT
jgi:hypothetical protein